jgi:hypothetical protein
MLIYQTLWLTQVLVSILQPRVADGSLKEEALLNLFQRQESDNQTFCKFSLVARLLQRVVCR